MATTSNFYPTKSAAVVGTLPAFPLGTYDFNDSAGAGLYAQPTAPAGPQNSIAKTWSAQALGTTKDYCCGQFCTNALTAQTIAGATPWKLGFAISVDNINGVAGASYQGLASASLCKSDGTVRTTLSATVTVGSSGRTSNSELTVYNATFTMNGGSSITVTAGDYIVIELGVRIQSGSGFTPQTHLYLFGTTAISADNSSTSDALDDLNYTGTAIDYTPAASGPTGTILYPRLELAPSGVTLPSGYFTGDGIPWNQSDTSKAGANALYLSQLPGTSQRSTTKTWSSIGNGVTNNIAHAQFLSDPLAAQSLTTANWAIGIGAILTNASSTFNYEGAAKLFLVNSAGQYRFTLISINQFGAGETGTAEVAVYSTTVSGVQGPTINDGDYLGLELGLSITNTSGGGLVPATNLFTSGGTVIASDGAAISSARAFIQAPVNLVFSQHLAPGSAGIYPYNFGGVCFVKR